MPRPLRNLDDLGLNLSALPAGLQRLGGALFDVRGLVVLGTSDPNWSQFPEHVRIPVARRFGQMHVLHGTMGGEREGAAIGAYRLLYDDGREMDLDIRYGRDLRDWSSSKDPKPPGEGSAVAWTSCFPARTAAAGDTIRLYRTTYTNPHPERQVVCVEFVSRMTQSAPLLVAVTVE
jgi:hypothetical protein